MNHKLGTGNFPYDEHDLRDALPLLILYGIFSKTLKPQAENVRRDEEDDIIGLRKRGTSVYEGNEGWLQQRVDGQDEHDAPSQSLTYVHEALIPSLYAQVMLSSWTSFVAIKTNALSSLCYQIHSQRCHFFRPLCWFAACACNFI